MKIFKKNKLSPWVWSFQITIILIFAALYLFSQLSLEAPYGKISGAYDNLKFHIRGERKPEAKIVIVGIDEDSIQALGRWPWSRDKIATLLYQLAKEKIKAVGLDIIFAEEEHLVPTKIRALLESKKMEASLREFNSDQMLAEVMFKMKDRLVLGWAGDYFCERDANECKPSDLAPFNLPKFSLQITEGQIPFDNHYFSKIKYFVSNISIFNHISKYAGLLNVHEDQDGFIRRVPLLFKIGDKIFPSFATALAQAGMKQSWPLTRAPITRRGDISINVGGGGLSFPYLSAMDVMSDSEDLRVETSHGEYTENRSKIFEDAYVLVGATSQGLRDIKTFAFGIGIPGIEGHAWALENILSNRYLKSENFTATFFILILMMIIGLGVAWALSRLSALQSIGVWALCLAAVFLVDQFVLFSNEFNFNFFYLYTELTLIAFVGIGARFLSEEKQKRHIHSIFGHYISPRVVQNIVKSDEPLSLYGDKKVLTIFFSDIRGFTKMAEKLEPRKLSEMLNQYMTLMTEILGQKYEGTLDKYIGDAIMAFWGAPVDQSDHAEKACLSALEMQKALSKAQTQFKQKFGVEVATGMGIHTGEVIVGNMGSEKNVNYTAIGDSVNLASRIEGLSKHYGCDIIISKSTYDQIRIQNFPAQIRKLDRVRVVGKGENTDIYQIFSREIPNETLNKFQQALEVYNSQKWKEALLLFEESANLFHQIGIVDKTSLIYQTRCKDFIVEPPQQPWDGSHDMRTK